MHCFNWQLINIGLALIDPETCLQVWLQFFIGPYPNWTYRFTYHAGLWKFVARMSVGFSDLFKSIYYFAWYIISTKFFVQDFFCWFLTCVYHIYWISIHWSWNLSLGVLANFPWDVFKPDIRIWPSRRFVEGCGEVAVFFNFTCYHKYIDWLQGSYSSWLLDIDI